MFEVPDRGGAEQACNCDGRGGRSCRRSRCHCSASRGCGGETDEQGERRLQGEMGSCEDSISLQRTFGTNASCAFFEFYQQNHLSQLHNMQAKRALRALRSLVKLQAFVKGYLVRKQTASTLQSLQALMRVQTAIKPDKSSIFLYQSLLSHRRSLVLFKNLPYLFKYIDCYNYLFMGVLYLVRVITGEGANVFAEQSKDNQDDLPFFYYF